MPSLAVVCGLFPALDAAEDTESIVITANRLPQEREQTVQPVDVIDNAELRAEGYPLQPIDPIGELPGAFLLKNGGVSGVGSLRLRGAPSYGSLILFDGVPLHDATGTQSAPDLAVLNPAGIQATEVLRGPQAGLYGSRAIGGVVNFRTLEATSEHSGIARVQGGSFGTVDTLVQATGPLGANSGYAVGLSGTVSEGISNQTTDDNGDPLDHEEDGFERSGAYARVEHQLNDAIAVFALVDSVQAEAEFDSFADPDDDAPLSEYAITRLHLGARVGGTQDRYQLAWNAAYTRYARDNPNAAVGGTSWTSSDLYGNLYGSWRASEWVRVSGGGDARLEEGEAELVGGATSIDEESGHLGLWVRSEVGDTERWLLAGTVRHQLQEEVQDATTWQISGRLDVLPERLRLHAMAGSAFRAPSLYEQFSLDDFGSGAIGNPALEAEESFGAAIGHRTRLAPQVVLSNTWFRTSFEERIDYDFSSGYINTDDKERIDGIETELLIEHSEAMPLDIRITHTWQDFDHADGLELRLPENVLNAEFTWHAPRDVLFQLGFTAVDDRSDFGTTLAAYTLVEAATNWRITDTWEVFLRGENLTDEDYELVNGYATPGISGFVGGQGRW